MLKSSLLILALLVTGCGGGDKGGCAPGQTITCGPVLGGDWGCRCEAVKAQPQSSAASFLPEDLDDTSPDDSE